MTVSGRAGLSAHRQRRLPLPPLLPSPLPPPAPTPTPAPALVRRMFLDARTRTVSFAYIFAVYSWVEAAGYRSAYPTAADRAGFARTFAGNDAIRLFYGYPYRVTTIGGYSAWRVGGTLALAAAVFGVLAAVRALRTEEDAGRTETVLAGVVSRRMAFGSAMIAIALCSVVLWAAELAGLLAAGLPFAGSAYEALATASIVPVFVGIGALASQLAPSRSMAVGLGTGAALLCWLLRVCSDTISGVAWLRWTTPLGWAEQLRPFAGPRPPVLLLPVGTTIALLLVAARMSMTRDVGSGLVPGFDTARGSVRLLSSPAALALRRQRGILAAWLVGVASFATVLGTIATSVSAAGISSRIQEEFAKFGSGSIVTPIGYLSFVFIVFIFAICLFVCSQVGAARREEADQQLETLLAQPVSRYRWLAGRMVIAAVAAGVLSGLSGLLMWVGAASQGLHISLPRLLEAGGNGVPLSLLALGTAALLYALWPRASTAASYALVSMAFLWYLVGSVFDVPKWLVGITPFQHIGLVPVQSFRVEDAIVMVVIGALAAAAALAAFRRRDLLGQ